MNREYFIVWNHENPVTQKDFDEVASLPGLQVIEQRDRLLVVKCSEGRAQQLRGIFRFMSWIIVDASHKGG